jgi:2-keto-4-pentenoate hydratase/2-oxohepta-3-ene-1,7-dioic acid hydratase in catechol pathway
MKLCRFSLLDTPENVRSGIFFENRVYETMGDKAAGIHELSKVRFLPPIGQPPAIRLFDANGGYRFANSAGLSGPMDELDLTPGAGDLTVEVRLAMILKDGGLLVTEEEAVDFVMGYTLFANLASEQRLTDDLPTVAGPFITTIDEFSEFDAGGPLPLEWSISINGQILHHETAEITESPGKLLAASSRFTTVSPGDLIAFPSLSFPAVRTTALGRPLQPNDQIQIVSPRLGALTFSVS